VQIPAELKTGVQRGHHDECQTELDMGTRPTAQRTEGR